MATFLGPCLSILGSLSLARRLCSASPGSCVGGAGALASSLCISAKDFTLGFVGGAGLG